MKFLSTKQIKQKWKWGGDPDLQSMLKANRRRRLLVTIRQLKAQWTPEIGDEPRVSRASWGAATRAGAGRSWWARRAWWAWWAWWAGRARWPRRAWRALAARRARRARARRPRARLCSAPLFLPPLCAHLLLANHPVERLQGVLGGPTTQFPTLLSTTRAIEGDHSDRSRNSGRLMKILLNPLGGADFLNRKRRVLSDEKR